MLTKGVSEFRRPRFGVPVPRHRPVKKRVRMTIGIGMLCAGGMIIAADTRGTYTDGATNQVRKVRIAMSADAAVVAAFASSDVPSAETLLSDIFSDLKRDCIASLSDCEITVRAQMIKWEASHPHGAPETEFILGVALLGEQALYRCHPPTSMNRKAYIAIGQGAVIVDPICNIFFRERTGPKTTLRQIAYLMFRAKNDYGSTCGGLTNAVFLKSSPPSAFEVSIHSMSSAERSSVLLDKALRKTMGFLLSGSLPPSVEDMERACWPRGFLTDGRRVIEDDGSIRELPPLDYSRQDEEDED
jgi:hypothetical protein